MRKLCFNFDCSTYVFGASSENCPDCGGPGKTLTPDQDHEFMVFYHEVQAS